MAYGGAESSYRPDTWGSFREDYRFTGKEEDVEVGLTYFGKRFYNAALQRWVSADPLEVHVPGQADANLYAYVSGKALKNIDPLGLEEKAGDKSFLTWTPGGSGSSDAAPAAPKSDGSAARAEPKTIEQEIHERTKESDKVAVAVAAEVWNRLVDATAVEGKGSFAGAGGELHASMASVVQKLKVDVPQCDGCEIAPEVAAWTLVGVAVMAILSGNPKHLDDVAKKGTPDVPNIVVPRGKYPEAALHIEDAQAAGHPSVLTIDRAGADANRAAAQAGVPKVPGQQIDEYPPAMFREGGAGASTRPITPRDNMGAGACIGNQCRGLPDGTQVRIVVE
jgi:RHS repeat-associated protein